MDQIKLIEPLVGGISEHRNKPCGNDSKHPGHEPLPGRPPVEEVEIGLQNQHKEEEAYEQMRNKHLEVDFPERKPAEIDQKPKPLDHDHPLQHTKSPGGDMLFS